MRYKVISDKTTREEKRGDEREQERRGEERRGEERREPVYPRFVILTNVYL